MRSGYHSLFRACNHELRSAPKKMHSCVIYPETHRAEQCNRADHKQKNSDSETDRTTTRDFHAARLLHASLPQRKVHSLAGSLHPTPNRRQPLPQLL